MTFWTFILDLFPYVVDLSWIAVACYLIRKILSGGITITVNPNKAPAKTPAARRK